MVDPRWSERSFVLDAVMRNDFALQRAAPELWADREVVLAAVSRFGRALSYASAELRADREVALAAARQDRQALYFVSPVLRADRDFMIQAVREDGFCLRYAGQKVIVTGAADDALGCNGVYQLHGSHNERPKFKNTTNSSILFFNMEFQQWMVNIDDIMDRWCYSHKSVGETPASADWVHKERPEALLRVCVVEIKADREVVLEAVAQRGMALNYAAAELRSDHELALVAVRQNRLALQFVASHLWSDAAIVAAAGESA